MKLLFYREIGIFARLIRWWTGSPYAHVELEFSDGQRLRIINGGKVFIGRSNYRPDAVAKLACEPHQESMAYGAAVSMIGASYDWKGIVLAQVLPWDKHDLNKWFCSEGCAYCLQQAGLLSNEDVAAVWSPGELAIRYNATPCPPASRP